MKRYPYRLKIASIAIVLSAALGATVLADVGGAGGVPPPAAKTKAHIDHILVRTIAGATPEQIKALNARVGVLETTWTSRLVPGLRCVRVGAGARDAALAAFQADQLVRYAEADHLRFACAQSTPYGITLVAAPTAWPTTRGVGAIIADLDTGVDLGHPDLPVPALTETFIDGETVQDGHGHGTHTAGIMTALDNTIGVVGVAPSATLIDGKVLSNEGSGSDSGVAAGIDWAVANHARVINMSLGDTADSQALHDSCDAALAAGVLVVAAAGNDNSSEFFYPADYSSVLAVAAVDSTSARASFSNFGPSISLAAPGVGVESTYIAGSATWNAVIHSATALTGSTNDAASGNAVFCGIGDSMAAFPAGVAGNVAHIRRGTTSFQSKVQGAVDAGAIGVIISNNVAGSFSGTLNQSFAVPVVAISQADGDDLQANDGIATSISPSGLHVYASLSGTSMASPHVAGVAALLFGAMPSATPSQVRTSMEQTALDLGAPGRDDDFGFGLVQANAALGYLTSHFACRSDFDGDGHVAVQDIFAFLDAWFARDPRADFNGSGDITVQDIFDFLSAWFAGCP